ncbi:MAG: hypothetical protein AB7O97_15725 [Planctomycetota bacterium]
MLSSKEFAEWSQKVVLFLHVTSRVDGEPYPDLLFQNGGVGFPTVSFLDRDGRLLQQVGNVVSLRECEDAWQRLQEWKALRAKVAAAPADAAAVKELFLLELRMGNRPFAEMVERRAALALDDAELAATEQPLIDLEFTEILRATPRSDMPAGGKEFARMFDAGRIPRTASETSFWQYQFEFAKAERDVARFRHLLGWLKEHRAEDGRLVRYMRLLERQLAEMERAGGR